MEEQEQQEEHGAGLIGRMVRVLYAPGETYQGVRQRAGWPDWLAPTLVVVVVNLVAIQITMPVVQRTQQEVLRERLQNLPEDQRQAAMEMAQKASSAAMVVGVPLARFAVLFGAGLALLLVGRYGLGGEVTYTEMLAVWGYSSLVGVIAVVVRTSLVLAKDTNMVFLGPGVFLSEEALGTVVGRFLAGLDLFLIWQVSIASVGLAVLTRTSTAKALAYLLVLLLVWLAIVAGLGGLLPMAGAGG